MIFKGRSSLELNLNFTKLVFVEFRGTTFVLNTHKVLIKYSILLVSMRLRETPVNIPNTMVKP